MSSDSKPLFSRQRGLGETAHIRPAYGSSTSEYSPLHQSNQPLHSSTTRYEFSAPSSMSTANSVEPTPPAVAWAGGAQNPSLDSISRVKQQVHNVLGDQVTPLRLAGHLSVLLVAAVILILSQVDIPEWDIALGAIPGGAASSTELATQNGAQVATLDGGQAINDEAGATESLQRAAVPFTIIPERGREKIETYAVQPGDTVLDIAEKFGLSPETIQWSNPELETNPDLLRIGDELRILPLDGVIHTVSPGDTLSSLAVKYKVSVDEITGYVANDIANAAAPLVVGMSVVVPGGTKPYVARQVSPYSAPIPTSAYKGSGTFTWPVSGSISQRHWSGHPAIDIGSWNGSPIKASDNGYVVEAGGGWNGGYGNYVLIDHGNGFTTLYAHLSSIFVRAGENVSRGEQIGSVGNTGNSTGPHLHFEVRYQGAPQNPFSYLP